MSFLDTFQGYHQIPLALDDQEKTAFVTLVGNYHYKVMPFGLKNTGSTYQRMMTRMFESLLGKNIEIYRRYGGKKQNGVRAPRRPLSCL